MDNDSRMIFERYTLLREQNVGDLSPAPTSGGEGGNWGGSLPKLLSLLPMGTWKTSSQKRSRRSTRSGFMSDHYQGNNIAYAVDFGLNTTFGGNTNAATDFAIKVARATGKNVTSWDPYKGKDFKTFVDGYRVQIIWLSNVGGNHYDHVHVGVKKSSGAEAFDDREDVEQDADLGDESLAQKPQEGEMADQVLAQMKSAAMATLSNFSPQAARKALTGVTGSALGAIGSEKLGKIR
jgi:hypothetical protein